MLRKGRVYKSTGSWYMVCDDNGVFRQVRVRGKLKIDEDISSSNPIAVGDMVMFEDEAANEDAGIISEVLPRDNYMVRVSPQNRHQKHIIAANLDAALVIATIAQPRTSTGFIDRFLLTAEAYHIPPVIVVNKTDVLNARQKAQLDAWKEIYASAGYQVFAVSALEPDSIMQLEDILEGKTTLFSGHSGVGKSTLINLLLPGSELKTKEVSGWSGKGQHTTTFAEMFDLPNGGRIIDTPGVKEFGLIDMEREEVAQYFPEMRALLNDCRFNNCIHINEPGCAVKEALINGEIAEERYVNYLTILDTIEKKW